jgi:hypothetical protein
MTVTVTAPVNSLEAYYILAAYLVTCKRVYVLTMHQSLRLRKDKHM